MFVVNKKRITVAFCEICLVRDQQSLKRNVPVYELLPWSAEKIWFCII